jgi:spore germination protein YaaH
MSMQRIRHIVPALLATLALSGSLPGTALAASSRALNPHSVPTQIHATTQGNALQREVFGFALASSLSDTTVGYPTWDFSLLSTVAYFGLHVQDDGTFAADQGSTVWNSSQLTNLVTAAHAQSAKVVLTIILQDFGMGTPHMCSGLTHTSTTIANTVAEVAAKHVDGVNVDYEGLNGPCGTADSSWARHNFVTFVAGLRSHLPAGSYLSVDTYASSAADPMNFFDTGGLGGQADSLFVMAYDLEYSNYARPPTNCSSFCLGPTAPLNGYYYNETTTASQYIASVGASKVILGVPYYGRKACVGAGTPNAYPIYPNDPTKGVVADTYLDASGEVTSGQVAPNTYSIHRDGNDPSGQERWDSWYNTTLGCVRELYWDDVTSLSHKYALVNADNLRGVGIWNLNYGGGAPELWSALSTYFSCPVNFNLPATETTTQFTVGLTAGGCKISSYDLQEFDSTLNEGWWNVRVVLAGDGTGSALVQSYRGHTYQLRARAHSAAGVVSSWSQGSTSVDPAATLSHPFAGMYTLDAFGGINSADSPPLAASAYWSNWDIARAARALPGASAPQSGAVLDGYGGLHPYGAPITIATSQYWPGWDIARDFAFLPDGSGGVVLDGWGGLHPFHVNGSTAAINVQTTAYWPGWDIARKVVIFSDGTGGYVMDGWGGLHPFGINAAPPISAAKLATTGYWPGWSIARDIVLAPGNGNHSGYVLDGWGGLHPFHPTTDTSTMPAAISSAYWSGWDIARGVWLLPGSATAGYTLDGWGGLHPFGGAPAVVSQSYWSGRDIAKAVWGG